ncbi:uncharacterized protein FIBRA_02828 [Fibroporia radiculosa]|uniref:Uncharacterized protein n=1 Tax=Fibroporia radiculosa TaxID=599839 RepID=J4I998_9APHY|nr:uncharacterized protein FIBRA_02828 [Fibroporia radiculosa]CCM00786.1 predicted protein [Fibroporia radiculosa]
MAPLTRGHYSVKITVKEMDVEYAMDVESYDDGVYRCGEMLLREPDLTGETRIDISVWSVIEYLNYSHEHRIAMGSILCDNLLNAITPFEVPLKEVQHSKMSGSLTKPLSMLVCPHPPQSSPTALQISLPVPLWSSPMREMASHTPAELHFIQHQGATHRIREEFAQSTNVNEYSDLNQLRRRLVQTEDHAEAWPLTIARVESDSESDTSEFHRSNYFIDDEEDGEDDNDGPPKGVFAISPPESPACLTINAIYTSPTIAIERTRGQAESARALLGKWVESFSPLRELREATQLDDYQAVLSRLLQEWSVTGGSLVALLAINAAVFGYASIGVLFAVDGVARHLVAFGAIVAGLGLMSDAVLYFQYSSATPEQFKASYLGLLSTLRC